MAGQIINEKLESLRRALNRVEAKCPDTLRQLQSDLDCPFAIARSHINDFKQFARAIDSATIPGT